MIAAFDGLRVVGFAQGVAAPYCGLLLARHGKTDVLKDWRDRAGISAAALG